jgi:hypothetical protein
MYQHAIRSQLTERRPALKLAAQSKKQPRRDGAEAVRAYQKDAIRVTDRTLF